MSHRRHTAQIEDRSNGMRQDLHRDPGKSTSPLDHSHGGILDGSAVEDLLELLFGLISAVGSRRPVIRLRCSRRPGDTTPGGGTLSPGCLTTTAHGSGVATVCGGAWPHDSYSPVRVVSLLD